MAKNEHFIKEIEALCARAGSKSDFARSIGTSSQTLGHWLSGTNLPRRETLKTISRVYGRSIEQLLGENESTPIDDTPKKPCELDADEVRHCMSKMNDYQRSAVLQVARAMVC